MAIYPLDPGALTSKPPHRARLFRIRGVRSSTGRVQRSFVTLIGSGLDTERPAAPRRSSVPATKRPPTEGGLLYLLPTRGYCCGLGVVLAVEGLAGVVAAVAGDLVPGVVVPVGRGAEAAGFAGAGTPDWTL